MMQQPTARVGVVIVNWNGWRDTLDAVEAVRRSSHASLLTIVVDNASTDDSWAHLSEKAADTVLIRHPENSGFAGGCNIGVQAALAADCDYIFLLNNDAAPERDAISLLLAASQTLNNRAVLGSAVKFQADGRYQFIGSRTTRDVGNPKWLNPEADAARLGEPLIVTDFVFGAAFFAPAALFLEVGMFDERFFLNFEETDLCYRARRLAWSCYVVPASIVHHRASASIGAYDGPMQTYFISRNELLFADKHATLVQRARLYTQRTRWALEIFWRAALGHSPGAREKAFLTAARDYILRRFGDCPPAIRRYADLARTAAASGQKPPSDP